MHSTVETTKQTILDEEYNGRSWEELSPQQRQHVEDQAEAILVGTAGDGVQSDGTVTGMFWLGHIGDSGYAYIVNFDSTIVVHHSLSDGTTSSGTPR